MENLTITQFNRLFNECDLSAIDIKMSDNLKDAGIRTTQIIFFNDTGTINLNEKIVVYEEYYLPRLNLVMEIITPKGRGSFEKALEERYPEKYRELLDIISLKTGKRRANKLHKFFLNY